MNEIDTSRLRGSAKENLMVCLESDNPNDPWAEEGTFFIRKSGYPLEFIYFPRNSEDVVNSVVLPESLYSKDGKLVISSKELTKGGCLKEYSREGGDWEKGQYRRRKNALEKSRRRGNKLL